MNSEIFRMALVVLVVAMVLVDQHTKVDKQLEAHTAVAVVGLMVVVLEVVHQEELELFGERDVHSHQPVLAMCNLLHNKL
jgi:hypothetical protein